MRRATSASAVTICTIAAVSGLMVARAVGQGDSRQGTTQTASLSPSVELEIDRVVTEIDQIEAQTLAQLSNGLPGASLCTVLLGKLLLYDKQLSVGRNEACAVCHIPDPGFIGPMSELNATTVAYPGSVRT